MSEYYLIDFRSQESAANVPESTTSVQVQLHPRRTSAVIVFSEQNTVAKVLAAAKKGALVAFATSNQATDQHTTGLRKHVELHKARCPGNDKLEQELSSWMVAFEEAEERKRRALEAAAADDGWTVVTRKAGRKRKNGEAGIHTMMQSRCLPRLAMYRFSCCCSTDLCLRRLHTVLAY